MGIVDRSVVRGPDILLITVADAVLNGRFGLPEEFELIPSKLQKKAAKHGRSALAYANGRNSARFHNGDFDGSEQLARRILKNQRREPARGSATDNGKPLCLDSGLRQCVPPVQTALPRLLNRWSGGRPCVGGA